MYLCFEGLNKVEGDVKNGDYEFLTWAFIAFDQPPIQMSCSGLEQNCNDKWSELLFSGGHDLGYLASRASQASALRFGRR
jgi:hypothetical protein